MSLAWDRELVAGDRHLQRADVYIAFAKLSLFCFADYVLQNKRTEHKL
jgi:hypothetical protein